jgi:hypothetical protein
MPSIRRKRAPHPDTVYKVTMEGTYFPKDHGEEKPYRESFLIEERDVINSVKSMWKNHVATPEVMQTKYHDFGGLATFHIVECVNMDDPESPIDNVRMMNGARLQQYIQEENYPIMLGLYQDTDAIMQAVLDYEDDPEGFAINQEMMYKKRGNKMETRHRLQSLNAGFLSNEAPLTEQAKEDKRSDAKSFYAHQDELRKRLDAAPALEGDYKALAGI